MVEQIRGYEVHVTKDTNKRTQRETYAGDDLGDILKEIRETFDVPEPEPVPVDEGPKCFHKNNMQEEGSEDCPEECLMIYGERFVRLR